MAIGAKYLCFAEIKPSNGIDSTAENVIDDSIPEPRSGHRVVVDSGNLYSIGGYNPDFSDRENDNDTYYPLFKVFTNFRTIHIFGCCWAFDRRACRVSPHLLFFYCLFFAQLSVQNICRM